MNKRILVTGATGFIGSNLVTSLLENQYQVDSLIRKGKRAHPKSNQIIGDITNKNLKVGNEEIDCVFHLASHTPLEKNKKTLEKVNLEGTKNLFNAVKNNTKSFLYVSGMGVYGETKEKTVDETFPYSPTTEFVRIRLEAQKFLEKKCKEIGIDFTVIHFGDVYGTKGWFYNFLINRLMKNTFRLPKGGEYYKGFVHIDDAVGSMISILNNNRFNERFNVVDSTPTKFKDFVNLTADEIGVKHPGNVPVFLVKALLGADLVKLLTTSTITSNKKISEIYNFKFSSYKEGIPDIISRLKKENQI